MALPEISRILNQKITFSDASEGGRTKFRGDR